MANCDNPRTGADFEEAVRALFAKQGLALVPRMTVSVGIGVTKKPHKFDLGSESPPVLVECKCHVWTEGGNSPAAKLAVWNEAMFYFACAPKKYRKLFVVQRSLRGEGSLADHYLSRYSHLVPEDVEFWELDSATGADLLKGAGVPEEQIRKALAVHLFEPLEMLDRYQDAGLIQTARIKKLPKRER